MFGEDFFINYEEVVAVILFSIGFILLLLHPNLIKKIIGLNIMDTAQFLFLASIGYIEGGTAAIYQEGATKYINPVPGGLVLTGIVVSVSVSALMLALSIRLFKRYHTLNLDEIYVYMQEERDK